MSEHSYDTAEKLGDSQADNYCHKNKDEFENIQRLNLPVLAALSYRRPVNETESKSALGQQQSLNILTPEVLLAARSGRWSEYRDIDTSRLK